MYYVYIITNLINGKKYIGMSINKKPWHREKYYGSGKLIKQAIIKYGKENFTKDIVREFDNEEDTRKYERFLISDLNAVDDSNYYNLCVGGYGGGVKGHSVSEETRRKISNTSKEINKINRENNIPYRKNTERSKLLGRKQTDDHIEKKAIGLKLYWENLDQDKKKLIVDKISRSNIGKEIKKETRDKLSKFNSTLDKEQVIEIVRIVENKEKTYKQLSEIYKINQSCICDIVKRRSYKWVWNLEVED